MCCGRFGLSTSYFPLRIDTKDTVADKFQVEKIAKQAADASASWFLLTLHHQPWIMMAPNATFNQIMGNPNYTTQRDVPLEFQRQLQFHNIKLILYVNLRIDTPAVRQAMGLSNGMPNDQFIENIAAVYREFSLRYGDKVVGWWVDAAGRKEYRESPNRERWFAMLANAFRAGNPSAVVAFNPGLIVKRYSSSDDYTAGESEDLTPMPSGRWKDRAQWHVWTYLGRWWESGGTRFTNEELERFVSQVSSRGGALTLDVGTRGVDWEDSPKHAGNVTRHATPHVGYIDPTQIEQIKVVMKQLKMPQSNLLMSCVN